MKLVTKEIKGINLKDKTVGILIDSNNGEQWVNGFRTARTDQLNKGETIQLWVYQEEYQGKMYTKFRLPSLDHIICSNKVQQELESNFAEVNVDEIPF